MNRKNEEGIYVFDTKIGPCGIAWSNRGIDHVQLPAKSAMATAALLKKRTRGRAVVTIPPASIKQAASRMKKHFAGQLDPLTDIKIDLSQTSDFSRKVYQALRKVKPGKIVTYAELAAKAGSPKASRAVGRAMATNPMPVIIPCHRVVTTDKKLGGFSAPQGIAAKAQMLSIEGVELG